MPQSAPRRPAIAVASAPVRWLYALKPASWPKLFAPALLGQALGAASAGSFSVPGLAAGLAFTSLDLAFIVLLNDWGDREVDALKRRWFPDGCSPKTIPDGILAPRVVATGGVLAGIGALAVAAVAGVVLGRTLLLGGAAAALSIFAAYSLPPLRLNYRGGGELLEAVGVGALLPWLNFHAQSGLRWHVSVGAVLPGLAVLGLASAIASGLSDETSDRAGGKRTFVTLLGNRRARATIEALVVAGAGAWAVGGALLVVAGGGLLTVGVGVVGGALLAAVSVVPLRRAGGAAVTDAFAAQAAYKRYLHRALWWGAAAVAAAGIGSLAWR